MGDKEKEAYYKGRSDYDRYVKSSGISEVLNPTYNPPKGYEEAYKAGWRDRERERKG
jgi:hypothetical protein